MKQDRKPILKPAEIATARLGEIADMVTRFDRECRGAEYTDLDAAWGVIYEARKLARAALRALRKAGVGA